MAMEFCWNNPVLTFYKEKKPAEKEPFAVVKAKMMTVVESDSGALTGKIIDFFELMGSVDCLTSEEGARDRYVICWFDDAEEDQNRAARRLTGVVFAKTISCVLDMKQRKTCNGEFDAKHGKLV
jgi:hypothetical protein